MDEAAFPDAVCIQESLTLCESSRAPGRDGQSFMPSPARHAFFLDVCRVLGLFVFKGLLNVA